MEDNKLTKTNLIELDWDSLLTPEDLSTEEVEVHATLIANYLSNITIDEGIHSTIPKNITKVTVSNSLLETKDLALDKISNDQLFEYFQEDKVKIDSTILFPKIKESIICFGFYII